MRISDWSSDVCSSDLLSAPTGDTGCNARTGAVDSSGSCGLPVDAGKRLLVEVTDHIAAVGVNHALVVRVVRVGCSGLYVRCGGILASLGGELVEEVDGLLGASGERPSVV